MEALHRRRLLGLTSHARQARQALSHTHALIIDIYMDNLSIGAPAVPPPPPPPPPPAPAPALPLQSVSMDSETIRMEVTVDLLPSKKKSERKETKRKAKKQEQSEDMDEHEHEHEECCEFYSMHHQMSYPFYSSSYQPSLQVMSGSHEYVINGFSLYRYMGCGMRLCSDFFDAGGQLFRLEVYPGGFNPGVSQYLSVFLTSPAPFNPNQIMYEVAIVDQSGEGRDVIASKERKEKRCQCCHFTTQMNHRGRGIVAAIPKMVEARFLAANCRSYYPCDALTITASVQVTSMLPGTSYLTPSQLIPPPPVPYHLPHQPTMMAATVPAAGYYPSSPPPPPFQVIHTVPVSDHSAQYQQAVSYQQPMQEYYSSGPAAAQPGSMSAHDQQYLVYMSTPPPLSESRQ